MKRTIKIALGCGSAMLVAAGIVATTSSSLRGVSKRETSFVQRKRQEETFDEQARAGFAALDRQDESQAKVYLQTAAASVPWGKQWLDRDLAKEYDKLGKDREAFETYHDLMFGRPRAYDSDQDDPVVLARYGDLATRFGSSREAVAAYRRAVEKGPKKLAEVDPPFTDDASLMASPAAAAHFSAGIRASFTAGSLAGREAALKEFERALALAPRSPIALLGLSKANRSLGRRSVAQGQLAQAESLASGAMRQAIHMDREYAGDLPLEQNQAVIRHRIAVAMRAAQAGNASGLATRSPLASH